MALPAASEPLPTRRGRRDAISAAILDSAVSDHYPGALLFQQGPISSNS